MADVLLIVVDQVRVETELGDDLRNVICELMDEGYHHEHDILQEK